MHIPSKQRLWGFTVVELLVVISIIAIVTAISVTGYGNVQRTARDTKRRGDLITLQKELEKYYKSNGVYPSSTSTSSASLILTTDKILPTSTIAQIQTVLPGIPSDFGDPKKIAATIFAAPQQAVAPSYLYIGSTVYDKTGGGSPSGTIQSTLNLKDGTKQVCNFGYSFSPATTDDKTVTSYVIGYYSEANNQFVYVKGQSGVPYTIATDGSSAKPCQYSETGTLSS